jgi:hypothetical protein
MIRALGLSLLVVASPAFGWTLIGPSLSGWAKETLYVYVNPDNCTIPTEELYDEVDRAIALWNQVPTSSLTMQRFPTPSTVTPEQFETDKATELPVVFCEPDFETAIGSADYVPAATSLRNLGNGPLTNAAIYLNAELGSSAEISQMDTNALRIAFAHEMGHMLGLGHSAATDALMYFSVSGKSTARLTEDDRMGITYLYPRNEFSGGAFGCAAVPGSGTPWGLAGALVYAAALIGAGRRIRSGRLL